MKKPKIVMTIIKEDKGYSAIAHVGKDLIATQGATFEELKAMMVDVVNLNFEDKGFVYSIDEIELQYDLESIFNVIDIEIFSQRIGMNQSLLAQYIKGIKKPSSAQTKHILKGVQEVGRELAEVEFAL